jgi:predicted aspartyl protease
MSLPFPDAWADGDKAMDRAHTLYSEGKFQEAQTAYSKIVTSDAKNVAALERLGTIALWENRHENAERHLKSAIECSSGLRRFWPFNLERKARLGMIYYRADRFSDAARLFAEAAGPFAFGPFRALRALSRQLALFGEKPPYAIEGPDQTRVDFVVTDPLPVMEVCVNGRQPVLLNLDTGGSEIILDADFAKEIGAEIAGTVSGEFAGAKKATLGLGKVDSIRLGEFIVRDVPIHALDMEGISAEFGMDIKGTIGTRLLMHFLSTIDYANGALVLRRAMPEYSRRRDEAAEAKAVKVIPFWLIETHLIVAWGTVNDQRPMLFVVDTGLMDKGFSASVSTLKAAGVAVDWTKAYEGTGGGGKVKGVDIVLDKLTLGSGTNEVVEHNVPGVVMEQAPPSLGRRFGFPIDGLVSHQFFRNYALTFDFGNMSMILEKNGQRS